MSVTTEDKRVPKPCLGGRKRWFGRKLLTQCNCSFYCTSIEEMEFWGAVMDALSEQSLEEVWNTKRKQGRCVAIKKNRKKNGKGNGKMCRSRSRPGHPYCRHHEDPAKRIT